MALLSPVAIRRLSLGRRGAIPTAVAGLTVWLDYTDKNNLFRDTGGSTPVTETGQRVRSVRNVASGTPSYWNDGATFYSPRFLDSAINGHCVVLKENNEGFVSPLAASNYAGASAKTLMTVLAAYGTSDNSSTLYQNSHLLGDGRGNYFGLYLKGNAALGYNWSGASHGDVTPMPGDLAVLQMRHNGSVVQVRTNLGSWVDAASGATSVMVSTISTRATSGVTGLDVYSLHDIVFNTAISDYDADALAEWGMDQLGL